MLVRMDGVTFLTDPMFSERASPVSFAGPKRLSAAGRPARRAAADRLRRSLSHDHYDHTDLPSIAALATRGAPLRRPARHGRPGPRAPAARSIELDWWQSATVGARARSTACPRSTSRAARLTDGDRRLWAGWVVAGPTRRFYHAGDTGYFDGFRDDRRRASARSTSPRCRSAPTIPPAIMQLRAPESGGGGAGRGRPRRAPRAVGMHWGTFDLTDEPLDEPPRRFRAAAAAAGLGPDRAWMLRGRRDAALVRIGGSSCTVSRRSPYLGARGNRRLDPSYRPA